MPALNMKYLEDLQNYMASGALEEDFRWSPKERREEILEFLEKLMDVADTADKAATAIIFRGSPLAAMAGTPAPEKR